ncbi:1-(5-phosphoribosyl)-5-[(5-phosphoribosylamino) methylideneamino] imidazole-4-carboxamide isomerase [Planctomycetales bacterium]|nr:1-(5-phosphoribosyl)-5-[(5-phosphoribosylamino) methylideneamino] imidazole-4-carboxamide isomerase [Planctomycetales bacterium]GHT34626.1 1-(5-phosphoribosyl)-5-[(5-phosphoribosylamino) methylideneamino] imidazole-4-carboxamide isomerase [Planctomycetales bacterium]
MQIFPAIDIRGGQCVRLKQGDYRQETVYGNNPAEQGFQWCSLGARHLHIVDLDGAKDKKPVNRQTVIEIVRKIEEHFGQYTVEIEVGGGIRNEETIRDYLKQGISRIVIGTLALKEPEWFRTMTQLFPNQLVLGIDAKNGNVATEGWLETSQTSAVELAKMFNDLPLAALVYTDIAKDGMMAGPNVPEMLAMSEAVPFPVVASGGVSTLDDVRSLKEAGIPACIIGKALYERTISLEDALLF